MSCIAEVMASMREAGGDPYGILCAENDREQIEAYGMPVRVSHFVPMGHAYVVDRKAWGEMRDGAPLRPIAWHDWGAW